MRQALQIRIIDKGRVIRGWDEAFVSMAVGEKRRLMIPPDLGMTLTKALEALNEVQKRIDQDISSDLLAIDIRQALHHLGEITGEMLPDDLLGRIFASFCIGK